MVTSGGHPFAGVAIAGVHTTRQARRIEGATSRSITTDAVVGAVADAGLTLADVDGLFGEFTGDISYDLGLGPIVSSDIRRGIYAVVHAAQMVATGMCRVAVVASAGAAQGSGAGGGRAGTGAGAEMAPWTKPSNELVAPYGMFTAAEFALMARWHMDTYGTTEHQMATVAATIRTNGHHHPDAVYSGRGPFTPEDILASPIVAEPFHLLDCATVSEGGCAVVLAAADVAEGCRHQPVWILGTGSDRFGSSYQQAPWWELPGSAPDDRDELTAGWIGRRAARRAFDQAGLGPADVDVCELYDPFSFEIIRQLEAFGFCDPGEGGALVDDGVIGPGGRWPVTTDGGTMSFGHPGVSAQMVQRVVRSVEQVRGTAGGRRVDGAEVAMCSNGGSGALFCDVMLVGSSPP